MQSKITIRRKPSAEKPPHARVSLPDRLDERPFESALAPDGWMRPKFQLEEAPESDITPSAVTKITNESATA